VARYAMGQMGDADDWADNELPPPEPSDWTNGVDEDDSSDEVNGKSFYIRIHKLVFKLGEFTIEF
jgi:hypothetical protein